MAGQFYQVSSTTGLDAFPSGQAARLGAALLWPAEEIARWWLQTFHDIAVEEAQALLAAASPGGLLCVHMYFNEEHLFLWQLRYLNEGLLLPIW